MPCSIAGYQVLGDRCALGNPHIAVIQNWNPPIWVDREVVRRAHRLVSEFVAYQLVVEAEFVQQPSRSFGARARREIEFHHSVFLEVIYAPCL